jgi:hypothetical protein
MTDLTVREASLFASRPKKTRSAVTNGRRAFVDGDGNSAWYRRRRDILELHLQDMGGRASLSEAQISLASRAASIEVQLEQMEGTLSKGGTVDLDAFTRASSHLRRILETMGVARAQRDVTPLRVEGVATPSPVPDLSQLSGAELDRLYSLLAEVRESPTAPFGGSAAIPTPKTAGASPRLPWPGKRRWSRHADRPDHRRSAYGRHDHASHGGA